MTSSCSWKSAIKNALLRFIQEVEPLKKFLQAICTFVRNLLLKRSPTASEALLSESLRCCRCGCEIREGDGFFFDCWFCLKCLSQSEGKD